MELPDPVDGVLPSSSRIKSSQLNITFTCPRTARPIRELRSHELNELAVLFSSVEADSQSPETFGNKRGIKRL